MILHRDDDWLVVDKPTGLATHAGKPGELGAAEWLALHRDEEVHIVSRLDRGTSGVLLLARHADASARAQEIHASGAATKTYSFLAAADSRDLALGDAWTREDEVDGKTAATAFRRIGRSADGRWVHYEATLSHGRRHQVRRHAALAGVPLLGDDEHGGPAAPRLALHCREVRWPGLAAPLAAPLPAYFTAVLDGDGDPALAACLDRRGAWPRAVGDAWRAVHRDEIPGLPAAIDIYGTRYNAVWFDEEADPAPLAAVLDELVARLGLVGGVVRVHRRNPHQRGLKEEVAVRGDVPETFAVTEHGLTYAINLRSTQHTGLFPDQRDTRRRVARIAAGRRVGNLFAFTCSFSVAAVAAGAEVAFSVDTARSCLETGKANFAGNGLADAGRGKFIQEDARRWLARQQRRREEDPDAWQPLDLLVCDPPVFASGKEGRFAVEKEWAGLARAGAELLGPDGVAVFANNHRTGDHARYRRQLQAVFGRVTDLRPPLDFPVLAGRPHHVRTFWCEDPRA